MKDAKMYYSNKVTFSSIHSFLAKGRVYFVLIISIVIVFVSTLLYINLLNYEKPIELINGTGSLSGENDAFDDIEAFNMAEQFVEPMPVEIFDSKTIVNYVNPFDVNANMLIEVEGIIISGHQSDGVYYFLC